MGWLASHILVEAYRSPEAVSRILEGADHILAVVSHILVEAYRSPEAVSRILEGVDHILAVVSHILVEAFRSPAWVDHNLVIPTAAGAISNLDSVLEFVIQAVVAADIPAFLMASKAVVVVVTEEPSSCLLVNHSFACLFPF